MSCGENGMPTATNGGDTPSSISTLPGGRTEGARQGCCVCGQLRAFYKAISTVKGKNTILQYIGRNSNANGAL